MPRQLQGVVQDTRTPQKTGKCTFIDIGEERMQWQKTVSETDAMYDLPPALSRIGTPFGSSTRADWEHTFKNKRDTHNPYASPGNYNATGLGVLSTFRVIGRGEIISR